MENKFSKIKDWIEEYIWWPIERIIEWPQDRIREIKWFIQRGRRGWADEDLWSLNYYLSDWMPNALEQLKKTKNSYPGNLTVKKWNKILDQMIEGFEASIKKDDTVDIKEYKQLDKIQKKGLQLFVDYYDDLWD